MLGGGLGRGGVAPWWAAWPSEGGVWGELWLLLGQQWPLLPLALLL